jgi:glycosyltransferase involved in cell wall biosynthesis
MDPSARLAEPRTRLSVGFGVATDASLPDRGSGGHETLPYDGATLLTIQRDAVKELRRQPSPRFSVSLDSPGADGQVTGRPKPVHVVMLVANDVATDTRVKKEALALAAAGLRVTVVGTTSPAKPSTTTMGAVTIMRTPVAFAIRDQAARRKADRLSARRARSRPHDGLVRQVAHAAAVAWGRIGRRVLRVRRFVVRARGALSHRMSRAIAEARQRHGGRRTATGRIRWTKLHPAVLDYESALAPVIDALEPDVIHAHDMHLVGVAAHARARARRAGRDVPWIYDAHEYVRGLSQYGGRTARVIAGWADLESEFIRDAARVVTVSPAIAEALQSDYALASRPAVVLNIPTQDPPGPERVVPLREVCGLGPQVPLITYSGGMTSARGVDTAIEALCVLAGVHLALVCVPHNDTLFVRKLRQQAVGLGVDERVHFVNPVSPGRVVEFLRGTDVGLIPVLSFPSHEMSLPNKLFEYVHACVPVVSSDLQSLGAFLREHRVGVPFPPGDPQGLAEAVRAVLADPEPFRRATMDQRLVARYSWSHEAEVLRSVYSDLLGVPVTIGESGDVATAEVLDLTEAVATVA